MNKALIKTKSKDRVAKEVVKTIASILIALSGAILFSDKVIDFQLSNTFGYSDSATFVWVFTQTISPIILVIGSIFKPYKISYIIPIYFYCIQLIWVFDASLKFDNSLLQLYAIGCVLGFVFLTLTINYIISKATKERNEKMNFLQQALNLSIDINEKK